MLQERKVNSEVLSILMWLGNKYVNKIPQDILQYLLLNSDLNELPEINPNKRIEEQNVSKEARAFLVMLKLKYWCESEQEKDDLLSVLNENEKIYQKELKEKYNEDNIFKSSEQNQDTDCTGLAELSEKNFLQKILNKIKQLLK